MNNIFDNGEKTPRCNGNRCCESIQGSLHKEKSDDCPNCENKISIPYTDGLKSLYFRQYPNIQQQDHNHYPQINSDKAVCGTRLQNDQQWPQKTQDHFNSNTTISQHVPASSFEPRNYNPIVTQETPQRSTNCECHNPFTNKLPGDETRIPNQLDPIEFKLRQRVCEECCQEIDLYVKGYQLDSCSNEKQPYKCTHPSRDSFKGSIPAGSYDPNSSSTFKNFTRDVINNCTNSTQIDNTPHYGDTETTDKPFVKQQSGTFGDFLKKCVKLGYINDNTTLPESEKSNIADKPKQVSQMKHFDHINNPQTQSSNITYNKCVPQKSKETEMYSSSINHQLEPNENITQYQPTQPIDRELSYQCKSEVTNADHHNQDCLSTNIYAPPPIDLCAKSECDYFNTIPCNTQSSNQTSCDFDVSSIPPYISSSDESAYDYNTRCSNAIYDCPANNESDNEINTNPVSPSESTITYASFDQICDDIPSDFADICSIMRKRKCKRRTSKPDKQSKRKRSKLRSSSKYSSTPKRKLSSRGCSSLTRSLNRSCKSNSSFKFIPSSKHGIEAMIAFKPKSHCKIHSGKKEIKSNFAKKCTNSKGKVISTKSNCKSITGTQNKSKTRGRNKCKPKSKSTACRTSTRKCRYEKSLNKSIKKSKSKNKVSHEKALVCNKDKRSRKRSKSGSCYSFWSDISESDEE